MMAKSQSPDLNIEITELDPGSRQPHALVNLSISTTREKLEHIIAVLHAGCDWSYSGEIGRTVSDFVQFIDRELDVNLFPDELNCGPFRTWQNGMAWTGEKWIRYVTERDCHGDVTAKEKDELNKNGSYTSLRQSTRP